jgi:ABC-type transporter Mla subunit MlaD
MILAAVESGIWSTIGSILLSLVVTFLFNYFIGLPKKFKDAKKAEQAEKDELAEANRKRDKRLDKLEEAVDNLPVYREQSKKIQEELRNADVDIKGLCNTIKDEVNANRQMLDTRLKSLESREKNTLREKIYQL